jgi:hypothetical protein
MKVLGPLEHRVRSLASELTPENVVHQGRVWVILLICGIALVCIFGWLVFNRAYAIRSQHRSQPFVLRILRRGPVRRSR